LLHLAHPVGFAGKPAQASLECASPSAGCVSWEREPGADAEAEPPAGAAISRPWARARPVTRRALACCVVVRDGAVAPAGSVAASPLRLLLAEGQTQKTVGDVKEAFKAVTSR
jgi:hypothetical protein